MDNANAVADNAKQAGDARPPEQPVQPVLATDAEIRAVVRKTNPAALKDLQ